VWLELYMSLCSDCAPYVAHYPPHNEISIPRRLSRLGINKNPNAPLDALYSSDNSVDQATSPRAHLYRATVLVILPMH